MLKYSIIIFTVLLKCYEDIFLKERVLMVKVSVVVPVYNSEKFLKDTLDSICNQTLKEIEIILVDDGSTDDSGKICDAYKQKDARIKVIHKVNEGVSAARNDGVKLVKGKYFYYADSDDLLMKNQLEKMYKVAEETEADLVFIDAYKIDSKGNRTELNAHKKEELDKNKVYTVYNLENDKEKDLLYENFNFMYCRTLWFNLLKTSIYKNMIIPYIFAEDTHCLSERLTLAKRIAFVHEKLYLYLYPREESMTDWYRKEVENTAVFNLDRVDAGILFMENLLIYFGKRERLVKQLSDVYVTAYNYIDYYKGNDASWEDVKAAIRKRLEKLPKSSKYKKRLLRYLLTNYPKLYSYYLKNIKKGKEYLHPEI